MDHNAMLLIFCCFGHQEFFLVGSCVLVTSFFEHCFLAVQDIPGSFSYFSCLSPGINYFSKVLLGELCFRNQVLGTRYSLLTHTLQQIDLRICMYQSIHTICISVTNIHTLKAIKFILILQNPIQHHRLRFSFPSFLNNFFSNSEKPSL